MRTYFGVEIVRPGLSGGKGFFVCHFLWLGCLGTLKCFECSSMELNEVTANPRVLQPLRDLGDQVKGMERSMNLKAEVGKLANIIIALLIIISGAVVSVLVLGDFGGKEIVIAILGAGISTLKSLQLLGRLEARTIIWKQLALHLRALSREIYTAISKGKPEKLDILLSQFYNRVDVLDYAMFTNGNVRKIFDTPPEPTSV